MSTINYRPHIDGLRAIAVIAVVLYHARVFGISGGYVGVDVFFVISGFLITSIIRRDLAAGTFSLYTFWERRLRRVMPALVVMLFATSIFAFFFLSYPSDYRQFGMSLAAQAVFNSNVSFLGTNSYFDDSARFSPLLHLWSLSVEEKFYIVFPLLLLGSVYLHRTRFFAELPGKFYKILHASGMRHIAESRNNDTNHALMPWLLVLFVTSFAYAVWLVNLHPMLGFTIPFVREGIFSGASNSSAGFYVLPARAWELLAGSLLAVTSFKIRSRLVAEVVSTAGILAILLSAYFFSDKTLFPGLMALIPVLGTVACIAANEGRTTVVGALLSRPVLVWTGLISYSLYLWHWPIFVFAGLGFVDTRYKAAMAMLIALSFVMAWVSYKVVEQPFQKRKIAASSRQLFAWVLFVLIVVIVWGLSVARYGAFVSSHVTPAAQMIVDATEQNIEWGILCFERAGDMKAFGGLCRIGDATGTSSPQFVLWGDSHAETFVPLFNQLAQSRGQQGVVFDGGFCPPVTGLHASPVNAQCEATNENARAFIEKNNIKNVVLVARWSYYIEGGRYKKQEVLVTDSSSRSVTSAEAFAAYEKTLTAMVRELSKSGHRVYIVEQVPEQFDFDVHDAFYRAAKNGGTVSFAVLPLAKHEQYQSRASSVIRSLAKLPFVYRIDPADMLCKKGGACSLEIDGKYMYRNEDHLSTYGTTKLEPLFTQMFLNM